MLNALLFIFVLGVLVIVHEFGHYIVARKVGIRVEKFSIGFGPVIFGKKVGDTEFVVALLPLGGFVKMAGESPEESTGSNDEFESKSLLQKFAVVFAGPLMNALLAVVLFFFIYATGMPTASSAIGKVVDGLPAKAAGIQAGDRILAVNGRPVKLWEDLLTETRKGEEALKLSLERDGEEMLIEVSPVKKDLKDIFGRPINLSVIGVEPSQNIIYVRHNIFESIALAFGRLWKMTAMIFMSLWFLIVGAMPLKESVSGPIGIYFMTQQAAGMGIAPLFAFMGSLSVSLFVLNLLPIPVLDGGHVLFILVEKIKGTPIKDTTKERVTQVGLFLILLLMAYVIFQDLDKFSVFKNIQNLIFPVK